MRLVILLFLSLFSLFEATGQVKVLQSKPASDTQVIDNVFELSSVRNTNCKTYIRIRTEKQVVDIYSMNSRVFQGKILNHIVQRGRKFIRKKKPDSTEGDRNFYQWLSIDTEKARDVFEKLKRVKLIHAPTDSLILGWDDNYLDCTSISFEFYEAGRYSFSSYYCAHAQEDTVPYKQAVVSTIEYLDTVLKLDSIYDRFKDELPKGRSYTYNNGFMSIYLLTALQRERWDKNKPLRDYLKSIKDTIDAHLNAIFQRPGLVPHSFSCYKDYWILIGRNGRLKRVFIPDRQVPRYKDALDFWDYLSDKREIRKCKRFIRKAFKSVDLSFLNLKTEVYRTISFGSNNEAYVRDNTIY